MYIISTRKLGIPQTKKEAFDLLKNANLISDELCKKMKGMVGFRNIAIHEYKQIDEEILQDVIKEYSKVLQRCLSSMDR